MTNPGSPQENVITERVNGILKEEWIDDLNLKSMGIAQRNLKGIVDIYNTYRPHQSIEYNTPEKIQDMGFKRHKTERVIGKMYEYEKYTPKQRRLFKAITLNRQSIIPRTVAPQKSCTSLRRRSTKINQRK